MIPDCTLTTACFDLSKFNSKSRPFSEAIHNMRSLLETPCYLVIYTDVHLFEQIKQIRSNCGLEHVTKYIVQRVEDLECFQYVDIVKKNRQLYHPTKDERTCPESHLVCCSKFELVLNTIKSNPFNTTKFGWIDANVGVNFSKICTNYKNNMLLHVLNKCSSDKFHLQILNVNDKKFTKEEHLREYYSSYRWVVCGCLFITGIDVGILILEELKKIFVKHTLLGYGHAEEMFYIEILDKYYDIIQRSYGDYNHILNNFINITTGLHYIKYIANSYMTIGYHKECVDCCSKVIQEFESYHMEIHYPFYFDFLFMNYVSLFYHDINKAKTFVKHILKLIEENPFVKNEYIKNKDFYDSQFKFAL